MLAPPLFYIVQHLIYMPLNIFLLNGPQPVLPSKLTKQGRTVYRTPDIALTLNVMANLIFELSTGVIIPISGRIAFDSVSASFIPPDMPALPARSGRGGHGHAGRAIPAAL